MKEEKEPTKEQIRELKAYIEGVLGGKVIMEQMGYCKKCGKYKDLRNGLCWDCAIPICEMESCPIFKPGTVRKMDCFDNYRYRDMYGIWRCTRPEGRCY